MTVARAGVMEWSRSRRRHAAWTVAGAAAIALGAAYAPHASAQTFTTLYEFPGDGTKGIWPEAGVISDASGALYGTTSQGGNLKYCGGAGCGTVFKLTPPQKGQTHWTYSVLYEFVDGSGGAPRGGLVFHGGALYGIAQGGGGPVYKLAPPASGQGKWTYSVVYDTGSDGEIGGGVIFDKSGTLYGATYGGGTNQSGSIFSISPGPTPTVLLSFPKAGYNKFGAYPFSSLILDKAGALYGTTYAGGSSQECTYGCGNVFKLSPPGKGQNQWTYSVLHSFVSSTDGSTPTAGLTYVGAPSGVPYDGTSTLYGTASGNSYYSNTGNYFFGTVFGLTPPAKGQTAWKESLIYQFPAPAYNFGSNGAIPLGSVILSGGELYGTTAAGGDTTQCSSFGCGVVYKLSPPGKGETGWSQTVLHVFELSAGDDDGSGPQYVTPLLRAGVIYGTTRSGGQVGADTQGVGAGTVWALTVK